MFYPDTFQISTPTDREIWITRDFDAPAPVGGKWAWMVRVPRNRLPICVSRTYSRDEDPA